MKNESDLIRINGLAPLTVSDAKLEALVDKIANEPQFCSIGGEAVILGNSYEEINAYLDRHELVVHSDGEFDCYLFLCLDGHPARDQNDDYIGSFDGEEDYQKWRNQLIKEIVPPLER